uniref:vesicular, overexpressed in cancer, prosurvival protein 1 isoform X2 n=1 Tax=Callithrix jacchus TaxID=9483 RepID=UPI0023DD26E0|nr:vesicular, overexpressed in cancer, prosurvival protein 1 isoform X2 [Callithrix jacchus]
MWGPSFTVDFPTPSRPSHHAWVLGHRPRGAQERRGEPGAERLRDARLSTGFVWGHLPGKQLPPAETLLLLKAFLGLFKGDGTTSPGEGEPSSPLPFAGRCSTSSRPGRAHAGVAGPAPRSRARGRASGSRSPRARAWRVGSERRPGAERGEGCAARPGSRPLLAWPPALAGSWLQSAGPPRAGAELRTTPATQRPGAPERTRGAMRRQPATVAALLLGLLLECTEAKKHCWYFEGLYPTYYICRSYEDCCGSRCCVRALSIQRLWYFWFLLMMGVLFCCGAGFFIRRRMYPPPLIEEPAFNVSYTRQPPNPGPEEPAVCEACVC